MADNIFREWMQVPQDIDTLSSPPKGYKHYIDNQKNGTEWMKTIIAANYPAITNMQIFHESTSDIGGNMIVRFAYNGMNISLPVSYQEKMNTLTPQDFKHLAPHIQSMNPDTRWLFNVILLYIAKLEQKKIPLKKSTHAALDDISSEIQSA